MKKILEQYSRNILVKSKTNKLLGLAAIVFIFCIYKLLSSRDVIEEYVELNLVGRRDYQPTEEQFIMYRCDSKLDRHNCGGLGDRLKGIMSAYVWSILTNRTLLIRINRPCNMATLLEPNLIDWNRNVNIDRSQTAEMFKYGDDAFKQRLASIDLTLLKQTKRLIVLHTNRNYAETIGKNPLYRRQLEMNGLDADRLDLPYTFERFYHRLFKLSPSQRVKFEQFRQRAKPTNQTTLICVQIRIGGSKHELRRNYFDLLSQPVSNSKRYWKLVREKFIANVTNDDYRVFLTTDNALVHEDGLKEFGDKMVYNHGPMNHIDYLKYSRNESDCSAIEKSLLDFECLKLCDMAVISRSQFGRMGLWNRPEPAKHVYAFNTDLNEFYQITDIKQFRVT